MIPEEHVRDERASRRVAAALAPLPSGYADVLDRVVDALHADRRVAALWLSGSVGRGVADAGSDLDLIVTVDTVLEATSDIADTPYRHRVLVFDRRSRPTPVPLAAEAERSPDPARLEAIATEFARQLAIFPDAVVARRDWLLGQEAVHNYRRFLYELYVESNQPLPRMGVKQWSAKLTDNQRDRLASLPVPAAEERSVVDAMREVQRVIRTEGPALLAAVGATWPQAAVGAGLARWQARGLDERLRLEGS